MKFWHWPDHLIGKRESRRLREEHNALANSHSELLEALQNVMIEAAPLIEDPDDETKAAVAKARAAINKATGRT